MNCLCFWEDPSPPELVLRKRQQLVLGKCHRLVLRKRQLMVLGKRCTSASAWCWVSAICLALHKRQHLVLRNRQCMEHHGTSNYFWGHHGTNVMEHVTSFLSAFSALILLIQSVPNTTKLHSSGNQNAKQQNHFQSKTLK